jgi:hypothetical protein
VFLASEGRGAVSKSAPDPTHAALWPLGHQGAMVEGLQSFVAFRLSCRRGSGYNRCREQCDKEGAQGRETREGVRQSKGSSDGNIRRTGRALPDHSLFGRRSAIRGRSGEEMTSCASGAARERKGVDTTTGVENCCRPAGL